MSEIFDLLDTISDGDGEVTFVLDGVERYKKHIDSVLHTEDENIEIFAEDKSAIFKESSVIKIAEKKYLVFDRESGRKMEIIFP